MQRHACGGAPWHSLRACRTHHPLRDTPTKPCTRVAASFEGPSHTAFFWAPPARSWDSGSLGYYMQRATTGPRADNEGAAARGGATRQ